MITTRLYTQFLPAPLPNVHFIWIGPPPETYGGTIGHDTSRPLKIAAINPHNPLLFWCQKEYYEHYVTKFAGSFIRVYSIEDSLLNAQNPTTLEHRLRVEKIEHAMKALIFHPERNRITDRVTIKEFIALFLLAQYSGYTLDTNIKPYPELNDLTLPSQSEFKCIVHPDGIIDYWLLYAPYRKVTYEKTTADLLFELFWEKWNDAEKIYESEGYSEKYRTTCRRILTSSLAKVARLKRAGYFENYVDKATFTSNVPSLGLIKNYHNTHSTAAVLYDSQESLLRHEFNQFLRQETPLSCFPTKLRNCIFSFFPAQENNLFMSEIAKRIVRKNKSKEIFFAILKNHTERLLELLEANADVTERVETTELLDETILHRSAMFPNTTQLQALLKHGADITAKSTLRSGRQVTPFEYAFMRLDKNENAALQEWVDILISHLRAPVSRKRKAA